MIPDRDEQILALVQALIALFWLIGLYNALKPLGA
jgi:hypothetical protein